MIFETRCSVLDLGVAGTRKGRLFRFQVFPGQGLNVAETLAYVKALTDITEKQISGRWA